MALLCPRLQQRPLPLSSGCCAGRPVRIRNTIRCSAVAVEVPATAAGASGIRWGSIKLQGPREEMEDDLVIRSESLSGFSFAAVFDGHAGFSSVEFLSSDLSVASWHEKHVSSSLGWWNWTAAIRQFISPAGSTMCAEYGDELFRECTTALQGGLLLTSKNFNLIRDAIQRAFGNVDAKLLNLLEQDANEDYSGATATAMFIGKDLLIVSHLGDSSVVISRSGKNEVVTNPHRPYGNNRVSLEEVKRIRAAGGWIVDGRICGDISVSRAFGDIRFKRKKNEMLKKGVQEGRWSEKFVSRVTFKADLLTSLPDIYKIELGPDAEFILLASDGLWDYMKSSDVVSFVRNQLRQHGDVQIACDALARVALDRGSQDNISIVIADLRRTDWQSLPAEGPNFYYEIGQALVTVGIVSLGIWMSSVLLV